MQLSSIKVLVLGVVFTLSVQMSAWHCDLISVADLMVRDQNIEYLLTYPVAPFQFTPLSVTSNHWLHPYEGLFKEHFVLKIPQGQVFGVDGWIFVDDKLVVDFVWQNCFLHQFAWEHAKQYKPVKKIARMAVIAQSGYTYYYHWMVEVLGRLAQLEMQGIEYDYLYVPTIAPFMKEMLVLWGVEPSKIVSSCDECIYEVDELIIPSLVAGVQVHGCPRLVHYIPEYIARYVKDKLMKSVDTRKIENHFSKKVFISRRDASSRRMLNEDEVFALFEAVGFERYVLSQLSVSDQIALFAQADIVVGALGSGLANVLFCKKDARVVDIFQARRDCTIYYLCQTLGLSYTCVKTTDFIEEHDGQYDTTVPLDVIENFIKSL